MILGAIAAIISLLFNPFSKLFLYLSIPLLSYVEKIVDIFANLKGNIEVKNLPWEFSASYYLFLISLLFFISRRKKTDEK